MKDGKGYCTEYIYKRENFNVADSSRVCQRHAPRSEVYSSDVHCVSDLQYEQLVKTGFSNLHEMSFWLRGGLLKLS